MLSTSLRLPLVFLFSCITPLISCGRSFGPLAHFGDAQLHRANGLSGLSLSHAPAGAALVCQRSVRERQTTQPVGAAELGHRTARRASITRHVAASDTQQGAGAAAPRQRRARLPQEAKGEEARGGGNHDAQESEGVSTPYKVSDTRKVVLLCLCLVVFARRCSGLRARSPAGRAAPVMVPPVLLLSSRFRRVKCVCKCPFSVSVRAATLSPRHVLCVRARGPASV